MLNIVYVVRNKKSGKFIAGDGLSGPEYTDDLAQSGIFRDKKRAEMTLDILPKYGVTDLHEVVEIRLVIV